MSENKGKAFEESVNQLKKITKEQIENAYRGGFRDGAVTSAAIIYKTFLLGGLEKTNILFSILKDIAQKYGCEDLDAYVTKMQEENKNKNK